MNTATNPLVSVIVPVYNVELYINECLNSIKQQTYQNLEIIVVEDCSTDNSKQLLQPHLEDNRIKIIQHKENSGLSAARNTGIEVATGEYIMFVDSDDIVDTRLVENCLNHALQNDVELVTYDFTPFKDGFTNTELPYPEVDLNCKPYTLNNEYYDLPHFAWLKFIRLDIVKSEQLQFPAGLYYEDWPFHWHLGLITKSRVHLPIGFYLYRQRSSSITGSNGKKLLDLFTIHALVVQLVQEYKANTLKTPLANKIKQSHWSILTRIDSEFLSIAIDKAKNANQELKLEGYKANTSLKNLIIDVTLSIPQNASLFVLNKLRNALQKRRK